MGAGERIRAERRTTEIREVKGSDRKGERQRSWGRKDESEIEKERYRVIERMKESAEGERESTRGGGGHESNTAKEG